MEFFYWITMFLALLLQPACLYALEVMQLEPYKKHYFLVGRSCPIIYAQAGEML